MSNCFITFFLLNQFLIWLYLVGLKSLFLAFRSFQHFAVYFVIAKYVRQRRAEHSILTKETAQEEHFTRLGLSDVLPFLNHYLIYAY